MENGCFSCHPRCAARQRCSRVAVFPHSLLGKCLRKMDIVSSGSYCLVEWEQGGNSWTLRKADPLCPNFQWLISHSSIGEAGWVALLHLRRSVISKAVSSLFLGIIFLWEQKVRRRQMRLPAIHILYLGINNLLCSLRGKCCLNRDFSVLSYSNSRKDLQLFTSTSWPLTQQSDLNGALRLNAYSERVVVHFMKSIGVISVTAFLECVWLVAQHKWHQVKRARLAWNA